MLEKRETEMLRQQEILFVDDESGVREGWKRFLSSENRKVSTADNGDSAILGLARRPIDLVISDLRMPGADGLEILEWVHKHAPQTPFVLITGYGNREVERRAHQLGAFGYLEKPVHPDQLEALAEAALRGAPSPWKWKDISGENATATIDSVEAVQEARGIESVEATPEISTLEVERIEEVPARQATLRNLGKLAVAPFMGLAFIMFLPIIGIGAVCYAVGTKAKQIFLTNSCATTLDTKITETEVVASTPTKRGTLRQVGKVVAAPFMGLAFILCMPAIGIAAIIYGVGAKIIRLFIRPAMSPSIDRC